MAKEEPEPWLIPNNDANVITLEHVLPMKPMENWPDWTDDEVKAYVKRIGNMVLLTASTNSNLKSAPFSEKKEVFAKSPYVITSMIADLDTWTSQNIFDRQKTLSDLALKAWPL